MGGALSHAALVQGLAHMPRAPVLQREGRAAVDDAVAVNTCRRVAARIETVGHALAGQHGNQLRAKMRVRGLAYLGRVVILGQVDMTALATRMHPRVGPPRTVDTHRLATKFFQRVFQCLLNGRAVGLALPADVAGAVILDGQLVARHESLVPGVKE